MRPLYLLRQAYPAEQMQSICDFMRANIAPTAQDSPARGIVKTAQTQIVAWHHCRPFLEWTEQLTHYWNSKQAGFDIFDMTDLDLVNLNTYHHSVQAEYAWHRDGTGSGYGGNTVDTKITVIVNASTEPYTGGQLQLFIAGEETIVDMDQPGMLIAFPSDIPHRVTPVTQGCRQSISYWITGPKWR